MSRRLIKWYLKLDFLSQMPRLSSAADLSDVN